ncbi:MAG TPA: hypothetical protein GXX27_04805 [Thermodesulfovibrio thiophilus]|nr:hypothetical protein [Thermodesulfovibrio thiophilus]
MNHGQSFKLSFPLIIIFISLVVILPHIVHIVPDSWFLSMHHVGIVSEYIKTAFELTALFVAISKWRDIWKWVLKKFRKVEFHNTGDNFPVSEEKVHGIVIPVSRTQQPEWIIRHMQPKYVSLLYTSFGNSIDAAKELINKFSTQVKFNLTEDDISNHKNIIDNAEDPLVTKKQTHQEIEHMLTLGFKPENIFVDTTGGKVPMSIGAFQAAEETGISTIYIVGTGKNGLINNPEKRNEGKPIFISKKI